MTPEQLSQLETWREFYEKEDKYNFVGVLEGELYDSEGKPTDELKRIDEAIIEGKVKMEEKKKKNRELAAKRRADREKADAEYKKLREESKKNDMKEVSEEEL